MRITDKYQALNKNKHKIIRLFCFTFKKLNKLLNIKFGWKFLVLIVGSKIEYIFRALSV